jgi:hypothetical protein
VDIQFDQLEGHLAADNRDAAAREAIPIRPSTATTLVAGDPDPPDRRARALTAMP